MKKTTVIIFAFLLFFVGICFAEENNYDRFMTLTSLLEKRGLSRDKIAKRNPITTEVYNMLNDRYEEDKTVYEIWLTEQPLKFSKGDQVYATETSVQITKKVNVPQVKDYLVRSDNIDTKIPIKRYVVKPNK